MRTQNLVPPELSSFIKLISTLILSPGTVLDPIHTLLVFIYFALLMAHASQKSRSPNTLIPWVLAVAFKLLSPQWANIFSSLLVSTDIVRGSRLKLSYVKDIKLCKF
jgi:hypothetical protein